MWWHVPMVSALGKWSQRINTSSRLARSTHEGQGSQGYIASPSLILENSKNVHTATYWLCLSFLTWKMEIILPPEVWWGLNTWAQGKCTTKCAKWAATRWKWMLIIIAFRTISPPSSSREMSSSRSFRYPENLELLVSFWSEWDINNIITSRRC